MERPLRVMLVFGTRPEAIKMAPLVKALQQYPEQFTPIVAVTGQHRQMLDQVLELFGIVPDYDLDIMQPGQDLYDVTSRILLGMRNVLDESLPDLVLVHGDTSKNKPAAHAAFNRHIPVGHVEAGLRTGNIYSPWPEEMNRRLTGRIATLHFAPTPAASANLLREDVPDSAIAVTGNTVIDALYWVVDKIHTDSSVRDNVDADIRKAGYPLERISNGSGRRMVLITGHRRENFGEGFLNICRAIKTLSERYPDVDFVYPMHLNPNVRKPIREIFGNDLESLRGNNMFFIEPLDYLTFVRMMELSTLVLTDSGGVQEEAPGLGKPVLVMRDTTERPEAVDAGTVELVGTDYDKIVNGVSTLLDDPRQYTAMSRAINPYGDGKACPRILAFISETMA